ncbi:MAG: ribonuclease R [Clostridium sp.]|nr:ribonuclease R [Clostridium sp.]
MKKTVSGSEPRFQSREKFAARREKVLAIMKDRNYKPMRRRDMAVLFGVPAGEKEALAEVLASLEEDGLIHMNRRGKYVLPGSEKEVGTYSGNAKGFGFVTVEGRNADVYISAENTGGALHGDRVEIVVDREASSSQRAEGHITAVLEHANTELVGLYEKTKNYGFVMPDNPKIGRDIFIPAGSSMGAVNGHKVVVRITDFGGGRENPSGEVIRIIGHLNDPGVDIESVAEACHLPKEFPEDVLRETASVPDRVLPEEAEGRLDLRELLTVTIDGDDSKDLDDAVTLEKTAGGYRLGVHIADVSHYVRENTALDAEALERGTSVYLADRVIPMLPPKLSNGICSLNEGEDRLALSCLMELDGEGRITEHRIAETVIRVDKRMTYGKVNTVLAGRPEKEACTPEEREVLTEYAPYADLLALMKEAAGKLRNKRNDRGAVDFDFPESKIELDNCGRVTDIYPRYRGEGERIIEDFMLAANETVAEEYYWRQVPFLYRIHEDPETEKMKSLAAFLGNFGFVLHIRQGKVYPKELRGILEKAEGKPAEALVKRIVLRSMQQAKYSPVNAGHFGLAAEYYTHFTSPIRRYPDLQIHRIIKENLAGTFSGRRVSHYERILPAVAVKTSALERRADEAEREVEKIKKVEYMEKYVGEEFDGVISSVTAWGFYVELPNTVEGLVHVNELYDDYYVYDEQRCELIGRMTGRVYRIGQPCRVVVTGCDRFMKTVDFIPAERAWDGLEGY